MESHEMYHYEEGETDPKVHPMAEISSFHPADLELTKGGTKSYRNCWKIGFIILACFLVFSVIILIVVTSSTKGSTDRPSSPNIKPPTELMPENQTLNINIAPDSFDRFTVSVKKDSVVALTLDVPQGEVILLVYARKDNPPTHVLYDDVRKIINTKNRLKKRATDATRKTARFADVDSGEWHFAFYNGGSTIINSDTTFIITDKALCRMDCAAAGHGRCVDGTCQCDDGWYGEDCSKGPSQETSTPCVVTSTVSPPVDPSIPTVSSGDTLTLLIQVGDIRHVKFTVNGLSDVLLQLLEPLPPGSAVSVFCKMDQKANFALYDVTTRIKAGEDTRLKDLSGGLWYIGFYNGGDLALELKLATTIEAAGRRCSNDCNLRGLCEEGVCKCIQGWTGDSCQTIDRVPCIPNNCTENGRFVVDGCQCDPGWIGQYCEVKDCIPSDCNDNGQCVAGVCRCNTGWKGDQCNEVDCNPSNCNDHGTCVNGLCVCGEDWQGDTCQIPFRPCPNDCSGHGACDNVTGTCTCDDNWVSNNCSLLPCSDCSQFGTCNNGSCVCEYGWAGVACRIKLCSSVCHSHGACDNGTCVCDIGWTGEDCTVDACPRNCSYNGDCVAVPGGWTCRCNTGYGGHDCSIGRELICDDGVDNDNDRLTDCADPECCITQECMDQDECQTVPDPANSAPATNTSTKLNFIDQISFLFEGNLTQKDSEKGIFNPELVCVLRGSVVINGGEPHPGVKVTINGKPQYGYTMSRMDGRYDLALNCGSRESVVFSKNLFLSAQRTVDTLVQSYQEVSPDVILIPMDNKVTQVLSNATDIQEVVSSMVTDEDGSRQVTMFFKPNTTISIMSGDGQEQTLENANVRVTEFTVGESGEQTMPAPLPPSVAYTYAVEMSIDELDVTSLTNRSSSVVFSQPVPFFTENFLGFPVGSAVPVGYLDRTLGQWVADRNGLVVEVLASSDPDKAGIDVTGSGQTATPEQREILKITDDELRTLKTKYTPGTQLWRVQITHMTPYDCNFPYGPPDGSCSPAECDDVPEPEEDPCGGGSGSGGDGNGGSKRRRRRSIASDAKRRIMRAIDDTIDDKSSNRGLVVFGQELHPPTLIESWKGIFEQDGAGVTCPVAGVTCGQLYTQEVSLQSPSRMLLTIPGTNILLVYNHFRQRGFKAVVSIPLSAQGIPDTVRNVHLEIQVAGVRYYKKFKPKKNLSYTFVWNRLDAYGREVQGETTAQVRIGYEYGLVYYAVRNDFQASFNRFSNADLRVRVSRPSKSAVFWIDKEFPVRGNTLPDVGLGGWTMNNHHSFDFSTGTLYRGDGEQFTIGLDNVLRTLVGTGRAAAGCQACGEGPGTEARITAPIALTESVDGFLFIGDNNFIRVLKNGMVSTLAVLPWTPRLRYFMTVNPVDGALLISDINTLRVYSIATQGANVGQIQVIAGTGLKCDPWETSCGDEGLALEARFTSLKGIAVGRDGNIFIVDNKRVRQIGNDGRITNYVGSNRRRPILYRKLSERYSQDLDQLTLVNPSKIVVDKDENMYIVDQDKVLRLSKDGKMRVVAGVPTSALTGGYQNNNPSGKATEHEFVQPLESLTLSPGGKLYVTETNMNNVNRVYRINPQENTINHVAGKDSVCGCGRRNCPCYGGEGNPPLVEKIYAPMDVVFTKRGQLVIADQGNRRVRAARILQRNNVVKEGEQVIPDESQTQLYVFDRSGYHVRTLNALTKGVIYHFTYTDDMQLESVVDGFNRTLRIARRPDGHLSAFVTPDNEKTVVTLDENGMLQTITEPGAIASSFEYNQEGLLEAHTPPKGCQQSYQYNMFGRLKSIHRDQDIVQEFTKTASAVGEQITQSDTLTGRRHVTIRHRQGGKYTLVRQFGHTEEIMEQESDSKETTLTRSDGVQVMIRHSPQGLWGAVTPVISFSSMTTPKGRQRTFEYTEVANLQSNDPLSVTLVRREVKLNGNLMKTIEDNHMEKTTSLFYHFGGSKVLFSKSYHDAHGRVIRRSRPWDGLDDTLITHQENSYREERGPVWIQLTYNSDGNLEEERGLDRLTRRYSYNMDGQRTSTILPSGKMFRYEYNNCKHLKTIIMPSGTRHELYTKYDYHRSELLYDNNFSNKSYAWQYSPDNELVNRTDPQSRSISYTYDESYRMTSTKYDNHLLVYQYVAGSQEPYRIRRYTNNILDSEIRNTYDGYLPIQTIVSYGFNADSDAEFTYDYSSKLWLNEITAAVFDDDFKITIDKNEAGHIIKYDNFQFIRRSDSNVEMTDGVIRCIYEHDKIGLLSGYSCNLEGSDVFQYTVTKDPNSTVIHHRSVKSGTQRAVNHNYTYDADGQLTEVKIDGEIKESYNYDLNGNRVSWRVHGASHTATYDKEDKISQVDGKLYSHSPNGFLSRTSNSKFTYTSKGELERAMVGDLLINYRYDGLNRLVFRTTEKDVIQFFYGDPQNPLQPSHVVRNNRVLSLIYNNRGMLIAMKSADNVFYVMCDHLGTPVVVFSPNGDIVKQMTYDSYGVLLSDTNPTFFMPIGYTGGIYDTDTKLVHFHFRDYMSYVGRWTARDPSFFSSNQPNLYQYVFNDPINLRDPLGLICLGGSLYGAYGFLGAGGSLCFDHTGATVCVELGAGSPGGSVNIDPTGGPKSKKGFSGEAGAEVGHGYDFGAGDAEASAGVKWDSDKGVPWDPCAWGGEFKAGAGLFGRKYNYEGSRDYGGDYQQKGTISQGKYGLTDGIGAKTPSAKIYGKGCITW